MRRTREQIPQVPVTIREIMEDRLFAVGITDARAHRPYPAHYDRWGVNDQESYERGRAWAMAAPRDLPLRIGGKLNPRALNYSEAIL
jgi:hypothetical protein